MSEQRSTQGAGAHAVPSMRFHHVGVAVEDIGRALETYLGVFGFRRVTDTIEVAGQGVRVCFVEAPPGVLIELVEGIGDASPVRGVLRRAGPGPYHLCYRVDDLDQALRALRKRKCRSIRRFELTGDRTERFAFLSSPDGQLFELCQVVDRSAPSTANLP